MKPNQKISINADPNDPDWMFKPILKGAFAGKNKTDKDVIGHSEASDYTPQ